MAKSLFTEYAERIDRAIEAALESRISLLDDHGNVDRQKLCDNMDLIDWAFELGDHPSRRGSINWGVWDAVERGYMESLAIENSLNVDPDVSVR